MGKANFVEIILTRAQQGYNNRQIADYLNTRGIKTPTGKQWAKDNVRHQIRIAISNDEWVRPEAAMPEFPKERNAHIWLVGTPFLDHDVTGRLHA